ncbi:MAG TPA: cell division protein SepF [Candidatus Aveggerthella stercoripullorum]|uniref:Cell division protein SepF n=1 Tax=Candidatus Aveggerthella stercoripullorum TaxID=2840688 RepID=A0A9D0ZZS6_9ACTN|nr:cell division protein SepF [Candidatus Aveggerthella stercoripullorum]
MARFSFSHGSDVLSGIKSKLGFSDGGSRRDYDDYDDYDDAPYEDEYADDPYRGDYAYDNSAPVSSRPSGSARSTFEPTRPRLVSFEDVRSSTQAPDPLSHDPLAARHVVTTSDERPRTTTSDAIRSGTFASGMRAARSAGYNSLFESTAAAASEKSADAGASLSSSASSLVGMPSDPTIPVFQPKRSVTVLKPTAYDEVEQIAKSLKAGDAVVLQLMNTQNALSKRILDFSFGVSSALDAKVDCIADKVFVITRGKELTDEERTKLRNQGVY